MHDAAYWIDHLNLQSHPEGGWFAETYRCGEVVSTGRGERNACTAIYFLLKGEDVSKFHRIKSDELWHFYQGSSLRIHILDKGGHRSVDLGPDPAEGQCFQALVPKDAWFGAELLSGDGFALVGCTVSPGFDFSDFEMAERGRLQKEWAQEKILIERLT